jgi:uncharacterized protein (DUF2141 family)
MSDRASGTLGPPSFEPAAFSMTASQQIEIVLDRAAK